MKKRRGNGSSAFLLRGTHLAAAAAAAYGDGREGQRAASPPEEDAAQLLAMDTTKRPLRLTAPSFSLSLSSCSEDDRMFLSQRRDLYSWDPGILQVAYIWPCTQRRKPAGPREPRIMRSSATHVAGHPWDFRQAYRLAATVSHPLLLLQCYCSTQIHAYICPAGICRSRREEKGRNLRQHPKAPNRGHYSRCVSTCMVHLQESQRYLCVTIISLRDTTLAPTDQDIKEHFGSGEEGGKQYCPLICYVMVVEAYH
uniref:Uncharacterized protein n=1 Tax=Oryza meridionalis TaxID=40149 RepID=A0A0E0C4W6_9ORYZ